MLADEEGRVTSDGQERDWASLLAAAQGGDVVAYRAFLIAVTPFVRGLARRRIRAPDAAEDVVQEALLTVHRVRHTYEPGRPVQPWIAAIVARRAIDALRKSGRGAAREVHDPVAFETFADPRANSIEHGESEAALARMMGELPARQWEALELTKLKEMSLVEASAASGQSVAALKVNVHRAIKRLRLAVSREPSE
jgi:RNA polymerase sigma-70 factor (ECF subfamily)